MVMLASIFRDSSEYIDRYFEQVDALRVHIPVDLWLAEGDSTDDTYVSIIEAICARERANTDMLLSIPHGGRKFTSVDHPERWNQIAQVWNALFDKLPQAGPLILVESDLIWEPDTMLHLLADLTTEGVDAVAPQSLKDDRFYDTWGHRWSPEGKFGSEPLDPASGLRPIYSAGSCIVMQPWIYSACRYGENDGMVGFGRDINMHGYHLYVDPSVSVRHP